MTGFLFSQHPDRVPCASGQSTSHCLGTEDAATEHDWMSAFYQNLLFKKDFSVLYHNLHTKLVSNQ